MSQILEHWIHLGIVCFDVIPEKPLEAEGYPVDHLHAYFDPTDQTVHMVIYESPDATSPDATPHP